MQPCLTTSALLPMAASAAGMLVPHASAHSHAGSKTSTVLLASAVMSCQALPDVRHMQRTDSRAMLQLTVHLPSGGVSTTCNGNLLMQSVINQNHRQHYAQSATAQQGYHSSSHSPIALASLLASSYDALSPNVFTSAIGSVELSLEAQSGYAVHPVVLESPMSLAALTAGPAEATPKWVQAVGATAVSRQPQQSLFCTINVDQSLSMQQPCSLTCLPAVQQHQVIFASEMTPKAAAEAAAAAAEASVAVGVEADRNNNQAVSNEEGPLAADSHLQQMDSQHRKLYIQAQVHMLPMQSLPICCFQTFSAAVSTELGRLNGVPACLQCTACVLFPFEA